MTTEAQQVAAVFQSEDLLSEVKELVEMGVSYIDALLTAAEKRDLEPEVVGAIVKKDVDFKTRVHKEASALHHLKTSKQAQRKKTR